MKDGSIQEIHMILLIYLETLVALLGL